MFSKVLIANRGAIACRIIRTLRRLGVASVAVYSEADRHSLHVRQADQAVCIGPPSAAESYLNDGAILAAAQQTGAEAIHPGYGFLSENDAFAEACEAAGIAFIGPTPQQMRDFGLKHTARALAEASDVPMLPGTGLLDSMDEAVAEAARIGYPVMLKSTAGGGGIGMQLCHDAAALREAYDSVRRLSANNFSNDGLFLEKYVEHGRHIEVQLFGDGCGTVIALGERDCSLQRRNQKVVEETPAPGLDADTRQALLDAAERLGRQVAYRSAGTVEYILDADTGAFYFLEMNTRLQVEHGVTEAVTGIDLVGWMVEAAAGTLTDLAARRPGHRGHAIQARLYAEDPGKGFQPATGLLTEVRFPDAARIETWVERGSEISPHYDPMIAKLIVHGTDRADALQRLRQALGETALHGVETNLPYLRAIAEDETFAAGRATTRYLDRFTYRPASIDVLQPGTQTTVQDWPGRVGYWEVGVPPSGPMDALAFRLGNRIVGNPEGAAGLEMTASGATLQFNTATTIALTGATMPAELDGSPVPPWQAVAVPAGARLRLGSAAGPGVRTYLLLRGGVDVPLHLGSRATFTLGRMGGHGGRALQTGDVLHLGPEPDRPLTALPANGVPAYGEEWTLRAVYGPHGAPDFFTEADIDTFFTTAWQVHYNSSRTGVRLIGPKPEWARADGGEAGLHPSNIHDNAYAIGTVDFTGDMPVILGPDGPSLGGFVCPATIVTADLWKIGQLRPGDRVRFQAVDAATGQRLAEAQDAAIAQGAPADPPLPDSVSGRVAPTLRPQATAAEAVTVTYRSAGERYLLVEYGPIVLDLNLRFRVQALLEWLSEQAIPGILEMTPGVRSLQIHYEPRRLPQERLLTILEEAEGELRDLAEAEMPSRIVHLPLAWDDSQTRLATEKYMQSVRADAPWCPHNIEFIRRINGLPDEAAVKRTVYDASYLVMGLGDVYLSAPLATPVDPRHRLVTTKYNPARTWTPENAVGIGGSYLCIYGMEGPGGYQFVGRTLQIWNRYHVTPAFEKPWLLRFFDQIRFYEVSEAELLEMRDAFPRGGLALEIEETTFSLQRYNRFLRENQASIEAFKAHQQQAFEAERQRWIANGQADYEAESEPPPAAGEGVELGADEQAVAAHVHANLWSLQVAEGETVEAGQTLLVLESMKMEIPLCADQAGTVRRLLCREGAQVAPGQTLLTLTSDGSTP
ncbi:urea carboxylase [Halorhodospira halophila]|uniref:Biotin carboxylase n=1 Tax=Halorhodospira halophila (strain DSM 244 / SL1) TaxID=349124 RepID=A1WZL2_HALHL|nr:urea carboxylase [Halorhodospira halophila]ABM63124.1 urea amidolyase related protein [Halorhodospira halophila SL1]MBK1729302.1 urea carboxylase [Halorhodospira halophila]